MVRQEYGEEDRNAGGIPMVRQEYGEEIGSMWILIEDGAGS
jgi:hypothetical protein